MWLVFASGLVWFIFERKKPKEEQSTKTALIFGFISWFVFKTLHRAVISDKGTPTDALLAGALFGGIILLICIGIKWLVTKKKHSTKEG